MANLRNEDLAGLVVLGGLIDDDDDEEEEIFQMMMVAARLAAQELMEMEEGEIIDEGVVWEHVTVDINDYHNMRDPCFRLHFRMSKMVFENLVQTIRDHLTQKGRLVRERTPLRDAVLMVVWLLATPDTFRSVALRFGVSPGTLYYHYQYIIEVLRELAGQFISWPNPQERLEIKDIFQRATGFPGIVGCIDCTHIYVTKPVENPVFYKNRHHTYSYNVQAVVDCSLLVRDLHVGEVGSMNDRRVLRRSPIFREMLLGERLIDNEHLVGDGGYTLTDFLLIPFANNGHLNELQRNYNRTLSQSRVRVENAFGGAKGKWRRLKAMHVRNQEIAVDHITACFVLHNFVVLQGEQLLMEEELRRVPNQHEILQNENFQDNPDDLEDPVDDEDRGVEGANLDELFAAAQARGIEKRIFIMEHLGQFH